MDFLEIWERLHNPGFNPVEFDGIRIQAGLNSFTLTPKQWIEKTGAVGITSKPGRYGALLTECNPHTIVRLPNGVFNPYTGTSPGDVDQILPEYEKPLARIGETRNQLKAHLKEALTQ